MAVWRMLFSFKTVPLRQSGNCFSEQIRQVFTYRKPYIRINSESGVPVRGVYFEEKENKSAHTTMERMAEYRTTVKPCMRAFSVTDGNTDHRADVPQCVSAAAVKPPEGFNRLIEDVQDLSASDVVKKFMIATQVARASNQVTLEYPGMDTLVTALISLMPEMTDSELETVLHSMCYWPPTPSTMTPNFRVLWNTLDTHCCIRGPSWTKDTLLRVADLWYHLRLSRICRYNSVAINLLSSDLMSLSPKDMVQLLFLINLQRTANQQTMESVETALLENLDAITVEELAIVSMGFFKTKTRLKSLHLLRALVAKVECNLETVADESLMPIVKLLRFSMTMDCIDFYLGLQKKAVSVVNRLWPVTCMHLVLVCKPWHMCDCDLLRSMMKKFLEHGLALIRLKELTKSVMCVSLYLPEDELSLEFAWKVAEEMAMSHRKSEIDNYPDNFVSLLLYMSHMNIYPLDLLNRCFGAEFQSSVKAKSRVSYERELFALGTNARIECPEYTGGGLPLSRRVRIFKENLAQELDVTRHTRFVGRVRDSVIDLVGGDSFCYVGQLLPQYSNKDILIILDSEGNPKPIPRDVVGRVPSSIIKPSTRDNWVALVLGKIAISGIQVAKARQLQALGYLVLKVPWDLFEEDSEVGKERLKDMICAAKP